MRVRRFCKSTSSLVASVTFVATGISHKNCSSSVFCRTEGLLLPSSSGQRCGGHLTLMCKRTILAAQHGLKPLSIILYESKCHRLGSIARGSSSQLLRNIVWPDSETKREEKFLFHSTYRSTSSVILWCHRVIDESELDQLTARWLLLRWCRFPGIWDHRVNLLELQDLPEDAAQSVSARPRTPRLRNLPSMCCQTHLHALCCSVPFADHMVCTHVGVCASVRAVASPLARFLSHSWFRLCSLLTILHCVQSSTVNFMSINAFSSVFVCVCTCIQ